MPNEENTGALARGTAMLLASLAETGVPAELAHPQSTVDSARLGVWPVAVLPETMPAQVGAALRLRVRYLVFAQIPEAGSIAEAMDVLDRVLVVGQPYLIPDQVPDDLWQALATPHRLGLLFDVPIQVAPAAPSGPRVTSLPQLATVSLGRLAGRVVTPGGVPLAGMRVAAHDGTATTHTDTRGHFTLTGVIADQPLTLLVTGRGLRLTAEVAAVSAEPVVITCEI
ncbi:hypothetical protein F4553_006385 [Allocatelliglobosispora scoriae]|uniref:Carboxypeptidase regulatory-like domain-containing protein n=1 Tax=Allocatelliglobosispora scoriae TaxID=643052 RepID=A0A841C259_9ACTN|nr:carboxypeptidase regulatory-like domain-containing protein [Allocatelliglobosispora scoriae]MBB5872951.1 hypothetical protein [Allocatelliglobosispora scoriae]